MIIHNDNDRKDFIDKLNKVDLTRKKWEFTAKPYVKNRTKEQNSYLWGAVYPAIRKHVFESVGENYTTEEIHESMKSRFIDGIPKIVLEKVVIIRETKKMKASEFVEYVQRIQHYFAEQGLYIPDPNSDIIG